MQSRTADGSCVQQDEMSGAGASVHPPELPVGLLCIAGLTGSCTPSEQDTRENWKGLSPMWISQRQKDRLNEFVPLHVGPPGLDFLG